MAKNNIPTPHQIDRLSRERHEIAITVVVPTTPVGQNIPARTQIKNLMKVTLEKIAGANKRLIWPIEEQIETLLEDITFWNNQSYGLVLLVTPESLRIFQIPSLVEPAVHVSDRFHLKPLLRSLTARDTAYVLALEEDQIRLFHVAGDGVEEVPVPDMPRSAADLFGQATINSKDARGRIQGQEGQRVRQNQYVRRVDQVLSDFLKGNDDPLIVHAADPLLSFFVNANTHPALSGQHIQGSPKAVSLRDVETAARAILDNIRKEDLAAFWTRFSNLEHEGRASIQTERVARAATFGAVDTLLIDMDETVPGTVCDRTGDVTFAQTESAYTYGVIDEIAARVLQSGGRVIAARKEQMPEGHDLAAILRWSFAES